MTTAQQTTLANLRPQAPAPVPQAIAGFFDQQGFELLQRVAKAFASSELVPKQYQGNIANCMIAMDMANRIGANPLMAMQNLYVVHGTPSWSSKFLVATINACGRFSSLRYEWKGEPGSEDFGCRAWAIERETKERLDGIWVTWKMVNAEGWASKNGSKWKTMPDQMFVYRAAAFWQRAYAPELGMGLQTVEEMHDIIDLNPDGSVASVTTESLRTAPREVRPAAAEVVQAEQPAATAVPAQAVDQETGEIKGNAPAADAVAHWEPSAEELAQIQARELAEANGQPAPQTRTRRERATTGGME